MVMAVSHDSATNATGNTRFVPPAGKQPPGERVQAIFPHRGAMTEAQLDVPPREVTPDIATRHRARAPDSRVPGGPSGRAGAFRSGGFLSSHGSASRN